MIAAAVRAVLRVWESFAHERAAELAEHPREYGWRS